MHSNRAKPKKDTGYALISQIGPYPVRSALEWQLDAVKRTQQLHPHGYFFTGSPGQGA